jgi:hypothetical protein
MSMIKTGASKEPVMGHALTPFPNGAKVMVLRGEHGFVPQPTVTNQICGRDGCPGHVMILADDKKQCQKCLRALSPGE